MKIEWSARALADLDRFAAFLQEHHPDLATIVAREILDKAKVLEVHPQLGYPIDGHGRYRQVVLEVLRAKYIFAIVLLDSASCCCAFGMAAKNVSSSQSFSENSGPSA